MTTTLKTLGAILDDIAEQRPDEILLTTVMHSGNTETMSRGALRHSSDRMALALSEQGVARPRYHSRKADPLRGPAFCFASVFPSPNAPGIG